MKLASILVLMLMSFAIGGKVEHSEYDFFFWFYILWSGVGLYNIMYNPKWGE